MTNQSGIVSIEIDCTGDVVTGDTIKFTEGVFAGSYRKPNYQGERTLEAEVIKDSYGDLKQQHTFTLKVLKSEGYQPFDAGKIIRRKGRNIYRNGTKRKLWEDESLRYQAQAEKHSRGDVARRERRFRIGEMELADIDHFCAPCRRLIY